MDNVVYFFSMNISEAFFSSSILSYYDHYAIIEAWDWADERLKREWTLFKRQTLHLSALNAKIMAIVSM